MRVGSQVSNAVARAAACDSDITRVVFGPAGVPVDIGRAQRLVPAHIRRGAEARDGGCVFAGCHAPTWWCDAHHVAEWIADHGPTSVENTALLCERHHTQVHHGFSIEWDDDLRRWRTYRPDGTEILVVPLPKLTDLITAAEADGGSTFRIDFADNRAERLHSDPLLV